MCSPTDRDRKASWLSWLSSSSNGDTGVTGFDAGGWAASTWVLHFMYESPDRDPNLTYDDLWRTKVASGAAAPLVIGSINLDEVAAVVGNSLGLTSPKPEWVRLRWAELAERLHIELAGNEVPPCWRWFPYRSWPSNLVPPDEGSLDGVVSVRLSRCLPPTPPPATRRPASPTTARLPTVPTSTTPTWSRRGSATLPHLSIRALADTGRRATSGRWIDRGWSSPTGTCGARRSAAPPPSSRRFDQLLPWSASTGYGRREDRRRGRRPRACLTPVRR